MDMAQWHTIITNNLPRAEKEDQGIVFDDDGEFFMSAVDFMNML